MIGSLFSGVGGLELGLERATGLATAWQCEYDRDASTVLAERFSVPNLHDITTVDWTDVKRVVIVCGGFPCQPFSSAGRRKGTADERWMWPEFARCVRALRPRYVVVENVAALLADSGAFGAVLGDLAEAGYDARWTCLRAADVGAPHRRERLFLVAHADGRGCESQGVPGVGRPLAGWRDAAGVPPAAADSSQDAATDAGQGAEHRQRARPESWQGGGPAADTRGAGRPKAAGGAPRQEGCVGSGRSHHLVDGDDAPDGNNWPGGEPAPADAEGAEWRKTERHGLRTAAGTTPEPRERSSEGVAWGNYELAIHRWEFVHGPAPAPVDDRGRLNPAFVEWMQGFPPGWVTNAPISRSAQLRCLGNAVVPQCAEMAWHLLTTESLVAA